MSALTSLLVRDDAVSVRQIEEALARQVVDGGELDTALLELDVLSENQLIAYCAASERAQPATREAVMSASSATCALVPAELAFAYQVSPLLHDARTLTVASFRALKSAELSALSERTGKQIEFRITTELRVHAALERFYGRALPPRLAVLLNRVDARPAGELIEVEPLNASPRADKTEPLPAFDEADDFQSVLAAAFDRASAAVLGAAAQSDPEQTRPLSAKRAFATQRKRGHSPETAKLGSEAFGATGVPAQPSLRAAVPAKRPAVSLPQGPLSAATAEQALAVADERDAVLEIYFRFARQYFDASVLFTIKDGRALGAQAHNVPGLTDIHGMSVPVTRGSALDDLVRTLLPRVVDLGRKDEDRILASVLKRLDAQPAALVPICIKRRVVAVLYGDRDGGALHLDELTDLVGIMPRVTVAFERIIRTRKALGLGPGNTTGIGDLSHAPTQRSVRVPVGPPPLLAQPEHPYPLEEATRQVGSPLKFKPPGVAMGMYDEEADIYATARIPIQPLPLDQFESPPRYFAKPPPGTGRYQSLAPKHEGAEEIVRRPQGQPSSGAVRERPPSARPRPRSEAPPARRSVLPTAAGRAVSSEVQAQAKLGPGSGAYRSQIGTTELISVPQALREARRPEPAAGAEPNGSGSPAPAGSFFPPAEPRPAVANNNGRASAAPAGGRAASGRPPSPSGRPRGNAAPDRAARAAELLEELCGSEAGEDSPAVKALHALGEPALELLLARFPGPLWFDRRKPHTRVPLGRDISPVCRALDAFGEQATERIISLLDSADSEVRYYATVFACDRVSPVLLQPLLGRLFDDDAQIRLLVRDALPHYRRFPGFEQLSERLAEQARSTSAPLHVRLAAIDAISVLRDVSNVPTLIALISHPDKQISVPSYRALTLITCQDFGKTARKWRNWHKANARRHRVEWLIEGLMHPDESLRAMSGLELQKLTQVYYGYVATASKRDRELAQQRYADWWRTEGRARLAPSS